MSIRRRIAIRRRRRGMELLELGLILGVILLPIMFGTIEFGTYFYVEHNLQGAAREGARAACVLPEDEWADAAAEALDRVVSSSSLDELDGMEISCTAEPIVGETGQTYVAVTVSTTWDQVPQGLRPMLLIRNASEHELKGYAVMRAEYRE